MDCPDDAFCTALHEVSGGWPVVAAQACKILLRDDGPAPSAKALRELEFELAEQFGDEVRHALDHAGARCGASPSDFRSLVRAGSMRSQDLPAEALEALTQVGLAVQDGQRVRPAWPFARQVVELIGGSRTAAFTTRSPPTWEEWRQLGALRPVPKNAPERVRRALVEVRSGPHPRHAWFACRELVDALFGWLAAHVPPAGLHDGDHPRPFSERRNRKEKLAHMRQAGRAGPDGLDPRLAKMLDALSKAEEFGAHHDGLDLEPLEGAAFLLLAEATTRRAGDWVAGRRG